MKKIKLYDIKHNFYNYIKDIEAGKALLITRNGKPFFEIKPVLPKPVNRRPFGLCAGEFHVPDDFDAPLPEYILDEFEGKTIS
ncbi:MAG: type II toxin-antitoxin system Phd/YefM family antitoxin [Deltaproteobacteria bacterium]|nr:type II toxin-antitoxin system Phd/YefM family antitoxin [Deltaproteobacteria bacterium]